MFRLSSKQAKPLMYPSSQSYAISTAQRPKNKQQTEILVDEIFNLSFLFNKERNERIISKRLLSYVTTRQDNNRAHNNLNKCFIVLLNVSQSNEAERSTRELCK